MSWDDPNSDPAGDVARTARQIRSEAEQGWPRLITRVGQWLGMPPAEVGRRLGFCPDCAGRDWTHRPDCPNPTADDREDV